MEEELDSLLHEERCKDFLLEIRKSAKGVTLFVVAEMGERKHVIDCGTLLAALAYLRAEFAN